MGNWIWFNINQLFFYSGTEVTIDSFKTVIKIETSRYDIHF